MLVMSRIKIGIIRKYSVWLMIISSAFCFFVLLKGITGGGARDGINLFGITHCSVGDC